MSAGVWDSEARELKRKAEATARRERRAWQEDPRKAREAAAQWASQKLARRARAEQATAALAGVEGVDIGEGVGTAAQVNTLDMIRKLARADKGKPGERREALTRVAQAITALAAEKEASTRAIQDAVRGLGNGSLVAEGDGTEIVRLRTEAMVPVRQVQA